MSLKSSNKTDTNVYTLEIEIGAEPFKAAVLKAYNKAKNKIALPQGQSSSCHDREILRQGCLL